MIGVLPRSRLLSGAIVAIEGLAVWVVAIFLASFQATGWIIWPGTDMYTTAVGTMRGWIATGQPGAYELLAYFGLAAAFAGPAWFWVARPILDFLEGRPTTRRHSGAESASEDDDHWGEGEWISATEVSAHSTTQEADDPSEWLSSVLESDSPQPDSIQTALANGDFLRGAGREADEGEHGESELRQ